MKLFKFILFCFILITANAQEWEWQNPLPQGNDLNDVYFLNDSIGFAVGEAATILKTENGGDDWNIISSGPSYKDFRQIKMFDDQKGYIREARRILKSDDGWQNKQIIYEDSLRTFDMYWLNNNVGWIAKRDGLFHTFDGGDTWHQIFNQSTAYSVCFIDSMRGWLGSFNTVYRTGDGGKSWHRSQTSMNCSSVEQVQFVTPQIGWLIIFSDFFWGDHGEIYKSTDGGSTWSRVVVSNAHSYLYHIRMINENIGFAVEIEGSIVYKTTDGGITWTAGNLILNILHSVEFIDEFKGWAVGQNGVIYKTMNGLDWQKLSLGYIFYGTSDFQFVDDKVGFAAGWEHLIKSTNSGLNWDTTNYSYQEYRQINSFYFVDSLQGWIATNSGKILYTNDGANNFVIQKDSTYYIYDIFFVDEDFGWAVGSGQAIYLTKNGGQSWLEKVTPYFTPTYFSVFFIDQNHGWVGGIEGLIHTQDGGETWSFQNMPIVDDHIKSIKFYDTEYGFLVTSQNIRYGRVYRTYDGGLNWNPVLTFPNEVYLEDVSIADSLNIYVGGGVDSPSGSFYSILFKSNDGGNSWQEVLDLPLSDPLSKIATPDNQNLWIFGSESSIVHKNIIVSGISNRFKKNTLSKIKLFPNYPNPFNPETTIEFYLPHSAKVQLEIFNVLGQKIRTLVSSRKIAGVHEVQWDGKDNIGKEVSSGVYVYQLRAGVFTGNRKLLLVR